jgi:hypothetical protein
MVEHAEVVRHHTLAPPRQRVDSLAADHQSRAGATLEADRIVGTKTLQSKRHLSERQALDAASCSLRDQQVQDAPALVQPHGGPGSIVCSVLLGGAGLAV